jgi:hypothetical protein
LREDEKDGKNRVTTEEDTIIAVTGENELVKRYTMG